MNTIYRISIAIVLIIFAFVSCDQSTSTTQDDPDMQDSVQVEVPVEEPQSSRGLVSPDLIGRWKLVDTKMGVESLAMDSGESIIDFKDNGELVQESDGFDPATYSFVQNGDQLESDLWDQPQLITKLSTEELVLTDEVDGVKVDYVYQRVR